MNKIKVIIFLLFSLFSCEKGNTQEILNGIDNFFNGNLEQYSQKKFALVLNHTSINREGKSLLEIAENRLDIVAIFTPEHGLFGKNEAGEKIEDNTYNGIPVFSLYGKNKAPTASQLSDVDFILFDMQDIGSRYYTYISTLSHVMKSASDSRVALIVLDRINPIGRSVEGPTLDSEYRSFVGMHPIPIRHGLTIGELSRMIVRLNWMNFKNRLRLEVIPVSGWDGNYVQLQSKPSPNIEDLESALIYSGMCLLEGTNLSEGRGTDTPFKLFGAPWMNAQEVLGKINSVSGAQLSAVSFTPTSMPGKSKYPKFENELCGGIMIRVTDMDKFEPIKLAVSILKAAQELYPDSFKILESNFLDKLYGSEKLNNNIINDSSIDELIVTWDNDSKEFKKLSKRFRLY